MGVGGSILRTSAPICAAHPIVGPAMTLHRSSTTTPSRVLRGDVSAVVRVPTRTSRERSERIACVDETRADGLHSSVVRCGRRHARGRRPLPSAAVASRLAWTQRAAPPTGCRRRCRARGRGTRRRADVARLDAEKRSARAGAPRGRGTRRKGSAVRAGVRAEERVEQRLQRRVVDEPSLTERCRRRSVYSASTLYAIELCTMVCATADAAARTRARRGVLVARAEGREGAYTDAYTDRAAAACSPRRRGACG